MGLANLNNTEMEDPSHGGASYRRYEMLAPHDLKELILKRDDEVERQRNTINSLENQILLLKSQSQQAKMNYEALEEHYKYKETSFKQEKEGFEQQLAMLRDEYEEKVN